MLMWELELLRDLSLLWPHRPMLLIGVLETTFTILSELGAGSCKHLWRVTKNKTYTENEVSKSSLASEMETREKMRIQVDKLMTEKDHHRTLLASAECKERQLFENLNRENHRREKDLREET